MQDKNPQLSTPNSQLGRVAGGNPTAEAIVARLPDRPLVNAREIADALFQTTTSFVVAAVDPVTTAPPMARGGESVADILRDMRAKERELWALKPPRMGNYAIALMLDAFIGRLEVAIGEAPPPRKHL
jgi:hypothetical protein